MHSTGLLPHPSLEEGAGKRCSEYEPTQGRYSAVVMDLHTLRASLSGTFLQGRKDVVNQCLEFGIYIHRSMAVVYLANAMAAVWFSVSRRIYIYIYTSLHVCSSGFYDRPSRVPWWQTPATDTTLRLDCALLQYKLATRERTLLVCRSINRSILIFTAKYQTNQPNTTNIIYIHTYIHMELGVVLKAFIVIRILTITGY